MRHALLIGALSVAPALVGAQTPAQVAAAAETITAREIASHVSVIADDSMRGRDTPSPGLERTAEYVANQLERLGLKAGGVRGTWFQRYIVPAPFDYTRSRLTFAAGERKAAAGFTDAAVFIATGGSLGLPIVPKAPLRLESIVIITGKHPAEALARAGIGINDKVVLYVQPAKPDSADQLPALNHGAWQYQGLIVLSSLDSAAFAKRVRIAMRRPDVRGGSPWEIHLRPEEVDGLREVLAATGIDLARARADSTPMIRELSSLQIAFDLHFHRTVDDTATAPNVIGILEGSDSSLRKEFLVIAAHMDHVGVSPGQPDSIQNGADDNASGTAGLLALAKAFSQPGARPTRSVVFLATSGGAKQGLWGSKSFVRRLVESRASRRFFGGGSGLGGSATLEAIAAVNLDMIGRLSGTAVMVDGLRDVEFATPPAWLAAAHPELGLTLVEGGTVFTPESDHYPLVRDGVPSLYFYNDTHERRQAGGSSRTVDVAEEARILRLVFFIASDIANAEQVPRWSAQGRRHFDTSLSR